MKIPNYILILFFVLVEFSAFAQDFPSEDDDGDLQGDDVAAVPLNGKILWLALLAIAFAYFKINPKVTEHRQS